MTSEPRETRTCPDAGALCVGVDQEVWSSGRAGFASPDVFFSLGSNAPPPDMARWPALHLCLEHHSARLRVMLDPRRQDWFTRDPTERVLRIYIRQGALDAWLPVEVRGRLPLAGTYFASQEIAATADEILDRCPLGAVSDLFLASKVLGVVWLSLADLRAGSLQLAAEVDLSAADVQRLHAARRLIHERYGEPLTLAGIAKACGLSRSKLTRGFRNLFKASVGATLSERRLQQAAQGLRSTNCPVSSIGYETGYASNAAFTRAFARRFGEPPTSFRTRRLQPRAADRSLAEAEAIL